MVQKKRSTRQLLAFYLEMSRNKLHMQLMILLDMRHYSVVSEAITGDNNSIKRFHIMSKNFENENKYKMFKPRTSTCGFPSLIKTPCLQQNSSSRL